MTRYFQKDLNASIYAQVPKDITVRQMERCTVCGYRVFKLIETTNFPSPLPKIKFFFENFESLAKEEFLRCRWACKLERCVLDNRFIPEMQSLDLNIKQVSEEVKKTLLNPQNLKKTSKEDKE